MSDLRNDYIVESREHLATFEASLLALEKAQSGDATQLLIQDGLRAIHSFKGDSGFLGFTAVNKLAHAIENVLEDYRNGSRIPSQEVVEALLTARDHLVSQLEDLDHPPADGNAQIIRQLQSLEIQSGAAIFVDISLDRWLAKNQTNSVVNCLRALDQMGTFKNPNLRFGGCDLTHGNWYQADELRLSGSLETKQSKESIQKWMSDESDEHLKAKTNDLENTVHLSLTDWYSQCGSLVELFREIDGRGSVQQSQLNYGNAALELGLPAEAVVWSAKTNFVLELPESAIKIVDSSPKSPVVSAQTQTIETVLQSHVEPAQQSTTTQSNATQSITTLSHEPSVSLPDETSKQESVIAVARPAAPSDADRLRSLRINVDLLDRMMNLIGELTLVRNQTLVTFEGAEGESRNIIQRLNSVTSELQDTVLQTRMQPVGNLFGRFPRMVRDLARQLGKEVEIVTVGQEVELDKTVLERLSDPLTHIIRNSIDHGLESPDQRVACGKPRLGKITLSALPADGQVCIEIRDDGRGIDPAAVKAKAIAMRLRTASELERLSHRELFSLILLPGFSTATKVTDVSGRGVGMDVVRTNVEELEGSLTIDSWPGHGTSMQLRVPLTLAIVPCLIVTVGEERFAVPQRALEEIVCLHTNGKWSLEQSIDGEVMRLRKALIPVVRFSEILSRPRPFTPADKETILRSHAAADRDPNQIEYILVLRSAGRRFGLLVDRVLGREEIVIKPMHPTLKPISVFSGATLMGDGKVALIANVDGILEHSRCSGALAEEAPKTQMRDPHEVHRVLLFEYGPNEQFALPLVQIQRVELLDTKRIERVGNTEFANVGGCSTRVLRLKDMLKVSDCNDLPTMFLILPKFIPEPMGILATKIIDTESLAIDLQSNGCERGVLGTARVRDRLSLFLDVQQLREFVFGVQMTVSNDRRADGETAETYRSKSSTNRILLVDDTTFFREIVKRYLSAEGVEILTAIDGRQGLELLAKHDFDLVVSDIEMPNMDGWQFCKAAREQGYRMPFVALTSLAKVENEDKAKSFGFDDFEEKLDHDRLRGKIQYWLKQSHERMGRR